MYRVVPLRYLLASGQPNSLVVLLSLPTLQCASMSSSAAEVQTLSAKPAEISAERKTRIRNISKSLEIYMESLRVHEKMMSHERAQFELGKRHLANIMGWPADFKITQDDIDRAIKYLFPSALTDKLALPVMKPPEEILPKFKKMDFDSAGRPLDPLFYTRTPKFYKILSEVHKRTLELVNVYDEQLLSKSSVDTKNTAPVGIDKSQLILTGSHWISQENLSKHVLSDEPISEEMYASLLLALEYLVEHPLAHRHTDFIMSLRENLTGKSESTAEINNRPIFQAVVPIPQVLTKTES